MRLYFGANESGEYFKVVMSTLIRWFAIFVQAINGLVKLSKIICQIMVNKNILET